MNDESLTALKERKETAEKGGLEAYARILGDEIGNCEDNGGGIRGVDDEPINDKPVDDGNLAALEARKEDAERTGLDSFVRILQRKIEEHPDHEPPESNQDSEPEKSAAALEEEHRAALADAPEEIQERTHAALTAEDAVHIADREQPAAQYIYDVYGVDVRDTNSEYELRDMLQNRERKRGSLEPTEEVSDAEGALSIGDRNRLAHSDVLAEQFIRREYGIDANEYDDVEELREAIRQAGGYSKKNANMPSQNTAFSDPDDWV